MKLVVFSLSSQNEVSYGKTRWQRKAWTPVGHTLDSALHLLCSHLCFYLFVMELNRERIFLSCAIIQNKEFKSAETRWAQRSPALWLHTNNKPTNKQAYTYYLDSFPYPQQTSEVNLKVFLLNQTFLLSSSRFCSSLTKVLTS